MEGRTLGPRADIRSHLRHRRHAGNDSSRYQTMGSDAWCPEFRPTMEEFRCFARYIRTHIEPQCAHVGMCKIVPPVGWFSRSYDLTQLNCMVSRPVSQHVAGKKGIFNVDLVERKSMTPVEFRALTESLGGGDEPDDDVAVEELERRFWRNLRSTMDAPVYGADIVGSLFGDDEAMSWNLNRLDTILRRIDLPGVTRSMLYFGMWRAMFSFHTEDMDLYSINYVHTGKPKFWYAVPPSAAPQLERAAQSMFPEKHHACSQFMRHKTSLISPARLKEFGVPYYKAFQRPGEFVITFPATYHQGFNLGFNIAEAVNFASLRWIPFGLRAKVCKCVPDSVSIDMDVFLTKLFERPEANPETLGEDAWVFSCLCGKYASSEEPSFVVEEPWFECSHCRVWAHLRCVHPNLGGAKEEDLPPSLFCHRCGGEEGDALRAEKLAADPGSVDPVDATEHPTAIRPGRRSPGKKRRDPSTTPATGRLRRQRLLDANGGDTPTLASPRATPRRRDSPAKRSLFIKGSTIQFEDHAEAKIAAVEGKFMRVHYKGQSVDQDEWLPIHSKALARRIVAITPPPQMPTSTSRQRQSLK